MDRRRFLGAGCASCLASLMAPIAAEEPWQPPPRFSRPEVSSDEGGLWAMVDRAEARMRSSPFVLKQPELQARVEQMACSLSDSHCPDVRVYLMHTPYFNASMAPNGMMQVWSGLMLRVDNEAQLAAVLGHEVGHYLARHSLARLRSVRNASTAGQMMSFLGAAGPIGVIGGLAGQVGLAASVMSYSRDHEREADRIGLLLMHKAGYDAAEAPKVWANLLLEVKARPGETGSNNPLFATHPPQEERQKTLGDMAETYKGGVAHEAEWQKLVAPLLREWLADEVKRGQHEESIAFLSRALTRTNGKAEYLYARGEVYRLRAKEGDHDAALKDFQAATDAGNEPPQTHRSMGFIYRARRQAPEAKASLERYLQAAPEAPDALMIRNYIGELGV
jgi:beta-barrel assembly-enhancing protease